MIHPTALVAPGAKLGANVSVGAYAIIEQEVEIGEDTSIGAHALVTGHTRIGARNRIFPYASIGDAPQDKKYAGEPTRLDIGDDNVIREFCTINRGTVQDGGVTRIGNSNWIMAYVHVAHDCVIGNHTIFANNASLAGHVRVDDHVVLGGFSLVHQFCQIGVHSLTAIGTIVFKDVPPFVTVAGEGAKPHGINAEGLKRRGFSTETIMEIKRAYRTLYRTNLSLSEAKAKLAEHASHCAAIQPLVEFLDRTTRGIVR